MTVPGAARSALPSRGWWLPAAALVAWWLWTQLDDTPSPLLVSPQRVLATAWDLLASGQLWRMLAASLARNLAGFAIGTLAGLVLGYLLSQSRLFERLVGPSFNTFKQVSLFAWIPLISVWFGLGDVAKVVFLSLAALVPVTVHTCDGLRSVPPRLLEVARVYGYSRQQTLREVMLPAALPTIFTGLYLALIYSWLATLGAEYLLVSGEGIGNTLVDGSEHFRMDLVLVGMVVIGLVGAALNLFTQRLERRLLRRYGR
ncbi:ABC transporter permease [uncultured Pseudomonas sp.]|uniref:ABC transporter permease n=1 Tax=uncultured Pseudomonas sp. TaxID=114707 RepID=UPI0025D54494|nr:ABC transporter permease [uncultured Pseudomonas sp.]